MKFKTFDKSFDIENGDVDNPYNYKLIEVENEEEIKTLSKITGCWYQKAEE